MDCNAQKLWENQRDETKRPSYEDLIVFIHEHSRTLQSLQLSQTAISFVENKSPRYLAVANHAASESTQKCAACKQTHYLFQCEFFRAQTPQQRFELVKRSNLCINCLKSTHQSKNCNSGSCKYCQRKHHTLLHLPPSPALFVTDAQQYMQPVIPMLQKSEVVNKMSLAPTVIQSSDTVVTSVGNSRSFSSPPVLAPFLASSGNVAPSSTTCQTVIPVPVNDYTVFLFTALVKVRDNLGQDQFARVLLDRGSQSNFISESLCQRLALHRSKVNVPVSGIGQAIMNVRYKVSVQFSSRFESQQHCMECLVLPKLTVSLPTKSVNIIEFNLQAEQIKFNEHLPVLQKTSLGYIIAGKVPTEASTPVTCLVSTFDDLDAKVKRFWEVENFDHYKTYSAEEQQCETHFATRHIRNAEGRYMVRLPIRQEMLPLIGDTWATAARRLTAVEKRLRADVDLRNSYVQFMEEYRQLGHMEEVQTRVAVPQFFLPHHAISRSDSSTTKTRIVFDGSCKSNNHLSLNDVLLTGPTVQPTLLATVLNFRMHRYAMTADIEKMYRQILVHPEDRPLQQILWRQKESEAIKPYYLNTVTYGTSCAPFLATRTLNQLAEDDGDDFPLATPVVKRDFYVDDLLTGSDNPALLEHIPERFRETLSAVELDQSPAIKTLGLLWFPEEDLFGFKIPQFSRIEKVTKRIALSEMSQLFDPLGLIGPVVASAKIWVLSSTEVKWDLHCFTDASERGYGCCIYAVSPNSESITSNLLIAKSRVAPAGGLSIPRLELCAAVLGSQVADSVLQTIGFSGSMTYWTDSTIVLHWIRSPPSKWKVFVSNRIAEIQRLTRDYKWRHVSTTDNPADRISRGVEPQQLLQDSLWWNGPSFLLLSSEDWPESIIVTSPSLTEQQMLERKTTVALHSHVPDTSMIHAYSELAPLLRVTAYCQRFIANCRSAKSERSQGSITVHEYDKALKTLVRITQAADFKAELKYLEGRGGGSLKGFPSKSSIKDLDLIIDTGLLRVHGRISKSAGTYDSRFPMVLPAKHHLTKLIAKSVHHQTLHAGPTQLLAILKQRFWPVRGRDLARRTVHRCITCFRCRPKISNQYMAPLPAARITAAKVFEHTGLDYCGPFLVRPLAGRGASVKVWVAVYVCFVIKAVVLDIVAGMSAAACVNSLRRFVSRVGRVRIIHCDNSTSFVGAYREIKEIRQQFIEQLKSSGWLNECLEKGIEFQFIPPRAPHATQRSIHDFWKRWSKEYISLLHQRPAKWRKNPTPFRIGSMVLHKKDNTPPKQWPLGRIIAVFPNEDNIVRVVDVRTQAGIRRRATTELCLLPIDEDQEIRPSDRVD
ncbi:uncharacterized protein LOC131428617 [Malaya genurostris]|uniref:uncharacterized protein LOC131428617 n=1 Tax=Malaya genurostris TaxID=325434 RepID=UPI0026F40645|nr:uncharacterized protein LOC131428617 [Malaya genurostris]